MKTHSFATTGMDGNVYLPYHWASHFIAGRFSELLHIAPVKFYNFSLYVVFLPLFFKALLLAVAEVREYFLKNVTHHKSGAFKPTAFVMEFIAIFVIFALFIPLIMRVPSVLYGESTLMAATMSMLIFALLFRYLQSSTSSDISKMSDDSVGDLNPNSSDTFEVSDELESVINKINFIAASLLIGLLALFKISFGFIFVCAYAYIFLRKQWYRSLWKIGVFLLSVTIFATIYIYNNETGGSANAGFNPEHTKQMVLELFTPRMCLYYSLCLIPLLVVGYGLRVASLSGDSGEGKSKFGFFQKIKFEGRDTLLMELLLLVPIIGFLPIALINLKHNSVYFTCFQILFGAVVFIAILPKICLFIKRNLYRKIMAGIALAGILILGGINYAQMLPKPIQQNLEIRKILVEKEHLSEANDKLFTNIPQKNISQDIHYQLIKKISTLNNKPRQYKQKACLWIAPTNRVYWDMQKYREYGVPFVATSLSGISLINGRPTEEFSRYTYYQYPMDETYYAGLEAVKQKAKSKGFSMLIEVSENGELKEHKVE